MHHPIRIDSNCKAVFFEVLGILKKGKENGSVYWQAVLIDLLNAEKKWGLRTQKVEKCVYHVKMVTKQV